MSLLDNLGEMLLFLPLSSLQFKKKHFCIPFLGIARPHTVILFSSRYLFPTKSICPTCEQAIQISMQIRAAAPPNRKLRHIFV